MLTTLILALAAHAVEVEPGSMHTDGEVLTASPYGVTVTVPAGQVAVVGEESIAIGNPMSALGATLSMSADGHEALRAKLAAPMVIDNTTWTASDITVRNGHQVAQLQGATLLGGARIGRFEAVAGAHGWTAVVVTAGKPKHAGQLSALHTAVVGSVKLSKPTTSAVAGKASTTPGASAARTSGETLPRTGPWIATLSGKQLLYLSTTEHETAERKLFLCADGRATYYSEFHGSYGTELPDPSIGDDGFTAGTASQGEAHGTWGVRGDTLIAANAEERAEWSLAPNDAESVLLDGSRWFVVADLEGHCR